MESELKRSDDKKLIRAQFNKQAENFSQWSVTQNREYLEAYFAFCRMLPEDSLLDVACGTGEFSLFAASRIYKAVGVDISDRMIELARHQASDSRVANATFLCRDVSSIPGDDDSFSIVICKSAFHHIHDYEKIIGEMVRCCQKGGRISIQDIVAFDNDHVNAFFEQMERQIDISHHVSLPKDFILDLYKRNNLTILSTFEIEIELNFKEYLGHANQSEECRTEIQRLLEIGLNDSEISTYFIVRNGILSFRRKVFMVLGKKER